MKTKLNFLNAGLLSVYLLIFLRFASSKLLETYFKPLHKTFNAIVIKSFS